jgi:hypothetical protein
MCGPNSVYAVKTSVGAVKSKAGVKLLFVLRPDGTIGESHKEIKSAHKLPATRLFANMNISPDGTPNYEKGIPSWLTPALQASAAKQAKAVVKAVAAYQQTLIDADTAYENALVIAEARADSARLSKIVAAQAKLTKLGAKAQ